MQKFTSKNGIQKALSEAASFLESHPTEEYVSIERRNNTSTILSRREVEIGNAIKSDLNLIVFMTLKFLENSNLPTQVAAESIEDALAEYCYFRSRAH